MPKHARSKKSARAPMVPAKRKHAGPRKPRASKRGRRGGLATAIGSTVGGLARAALGSFIRGSGSYHVGRNSLLHGGAVPSFRSEGDGVRLCHREYLADVIGGNLFSTVSLSINPGVSDTFPWLSTVAQAFEEYRFEGLVFEYRSSSGSVASAAPTLGNVILATQYNALDEPFVTKQQMDSYEYSTSLVPSVCGLHGVECATSLTPVGTLYVRSGGVPAGADPRLYDLGTFTVATQGQQSTYQVGELWVSYDVVLRKPRMSTETTLGPTTYAHIMCGTVAKDCTQYSPFSPTLDQIVTRYSSMPTEAYSLTPATIVLQIPGVYAINVAFLDNVDTFSSAATYATGSNLRLVDINSQPPPNGFVAGGAHSAAIILYVQVLAAGGGSANSIAVTAPGSMGQGYTDVWLFALPDVGAP